MFEKVRKQNVAYYCLLVGLSLLLSSLIEVIVYIPIIFIFGESILESSFDMLLSLYMTVITSSVVFYIALKKENFTLESLGLKNKTIFKRYLLGLLIGFVMLSASLLITYLLGGVRDVGGVFDQPFLIFLFFIGFVFQGFEEELMCRGLMLRGLSRSKSVFFSVLFNSFYFALLHLANPGITLLPLINLFLAGLSFSCMAIYFDDLWVASGAHTMWNFAQGNIYGILVSGMSMGPTLFRFELSSNSIISGGKFGLEGGMGVLIVEGITIFVFYKLLKNKKYHGGEQNG